MITRLSRHALAAAAIAITAGCSTAAGSVPTGQQRIDLRYAGGAPVGGIARVDVPLGGRVVLAVSSDVDEELHLHGYDRLVEMPAGGTAQLTFTADIPGVFGAEAERTGTQLVRLEVR
jgi:hypothetical protein